MEISLHKLYLYHYFYVIKNTINGKQYAGIHSTDNLDDGYLGSGKLIKQAVLKYGKESFIVELRNFFNTREEALLYEKEFVDHTIVKSDIWYNLTEGGNCPPSPLGIKKSTEAKKNMSASKSGCKNPFYGKNLSEEHKSKISKSLSSKPKPERTEEHKINHANSLKGRTISDEIKFKISNSLKGRAFSDTHRQNLSDSKKGKPSNAKGCVKEKVTCPHCLKIGAKGAMQRWHFDNCKDKKQWK